MYLSHSHVRAPTEENESFYCHNSNWICLLQNIKLLKRSKYINIINILIKKNTRTGLFADKIKENIEKF